MKRARQLILVVRECSTSYTSAIHIPDERAASLRDGLLMLCTPLRLLDGPPAIVRCDPAPGFQALANDPQLSATRLQIEIGEAKNPNKNPVAERAIQELREELRKIDPHDQPITPTQLAVTTANLNTKLRSHGISAREFLYQRDQFSGTQIPLSDSDLIDEQHLRRTSNHLPSVRSKFPKSPDTVGPSPSLSIGDIVYIRSDRDKSKARNRYLVTGLDQQYAYVSKFVGKQLRSKSYKVHQRECYLVPSQVPPILRHMEPEASDSEDDDPSTLPQPISQEDRPILPEIIPDPIIPGAVDPPSAPNSPGATQLPIAPNPPGGLDPSTVPPQQFHQAPVPRRKSVRQKQPPAYLKDYDTDFV